MKNKNESQGCSFCIRRGFPILLARPAIMSQHDILPVMPKSIHVPVKAQGETAYTLRLLRSGYLNIWDELGNSWINYYITDGVIYDISHSIDEFIAGNWGLGSLYFTSAAAGSVIIYVLIFAPLWGPIAMIISLIILLGTAIFIALDLPNNLQKWLQQCLWGKLPEKGLSKIKEFEMFKEFEMLKDSDVVDMFELTTYPTMQIEQDEFKAALGGF